MKRLLVVAVCVVGITAHSPADSQKIQQALEHLRMALNTHDFEHLEPYLADDFSFEGYGGDMGRTIMRQVVSQYPKNIRSVVIKDLSESADHVITTAEFIFSGESEEHTLTFSSDYKFLTAPVVQVQLAGHEAQKERGSPAQYTGPQKTVVPFRLVKQLILVEAEVEGVRGNFLVDSGSPGLAVNARTLPDLDGYGNAADRPVHGAGGVVQDAREVNVSGFKWQGIEMASTDAIYYDLTHLEENLGVGLVGIIGVDLLQQFCLVFDYDNNELTLIDGDQSVSWANDPAFIIGFTMIGHIPIIDVSIGGQPARFGIDCGAAGAMLFTKWEARLQDHYEVIGQSRLTGADRNSQLGTDVRLDGFSVGSLVYEDHTFRFNDLQFNHEVTIDGLIGYQFLAQHKTAIDYKNRKLYVWI